MKRPDGWDIASIVWGALWLLVMAICIANGCEAVS